MIKNSFEDGNWVCYQEGWIPKPCFRLLKISVALFQITYVLIMLNFFVWFSRIALEFL